MNELHIRHALERVNAEWNNARAKKVQEGIHRKQRQRRQRLLIIKITTISAAVMLLLAVMFWGIVRVSKEQSSPIEMAGVKSDEDIQREIKTGFVAFNDGSVAENINSNSNIEVVEHLSSRITLRIKTGGGRFNVTQNHERIFRVQAGEVTVTVKGTEFVVEHLGYMVKVRVETGIVEVSWPEGTKIIEAGQEGLFPSINSQDDSIIATDTDEAQVISNDHNLKKRDWRYWAHKGDFEEASKLIGREKNVRDTVDDLLLAADVMRLSGQLSKALDYFKKIVEDHADDPRAALAEFTRGRILLSQLGRPREAAEAFLRVQGLAPNSSLVEDALAREVESWYRLGEQGHAMEKARYYLERYPNGRRIKAVRRFGGIE